MPKSKVSNHLPDFLKRTLAYTACQLGMFFAIPLVFQVLAVSVQAALGHNSFYLVSRVLIFLIIGATAAFIPFLLIAAFVAALVTMGKITLTRRAILIGSACIALAVIGILVRLWGNIPIEYL